MTMRNRRNPPTRRLAIERLENRSMLAAVAAPQAAVMDSDDPSPPNLCDAWVHLEFLLAMNAKDAAKQCPESTNPAESNLPDATSPADAGEVASDSNGSEPSAAADAGDGGASGIRIHGFAPNGHTDLNDTPSPETKDVPTLNAVSGDASQANGESQRAAPVDLQRIFLDPVPERRPAPPAFATPTAKENAVGLLASSRRTAGSRSLGVAMRPALGVTCMMDGEADTTSIANGANSFTSVAFTTQILGSSLTGRLLRHSPDSPAIDKAVTSPNRVHTYFVARQDTPLARNNEVGAVPGIAVLRGRPSRPPTEAVSKGKLLLAEPTESQSKSTPGRPVAVQMLNRVRIAAEAEPSTSRQTM